jgi:hypothetical protein
MTLYSQQDPRWKNEILGTKGTIGLYGCTITCLGYFADLTPSQVNAAMKKAGAYSDGNLVDWVKIHSAIPSLTSEVRSKIYDNSVVLGAIQKYGGCLVEVKATPIGGTGNHWVVFTGDGKSQDPWTGKERPTSDWEAVGYAVIRTTLKPSTPPESALKYTEEEMSAVRLERDRNWNLYQESQGTITELEGQLKGVKGDHESFLEYLGSKLSVIADMNAIKGALDRLLGVEEQLRLAQRSLEQEKKKHYVEVSELQEDLKTLRLEIEKQQKENSTLLQRVIDLENKSKAQEQQKQTITRFQAFIKEVQKYFERKS